MPAWQMDGEVADCVRRRRQWIYTEQEKLSAKESLLVDAWAT